MKKLLLLITPILFLFWVGFSDYMSYIMPAGGWTAGSVAWVNFMLGRDLVLTSFSWKDGASTVCTHDWLVSWSTEIRSGSRTSPLNVTWISIPLDRWVKYGLYLAATWAGWSCTAVRLATANTMWLYSSGDFTVINSFYGGISQTYIASYLYHFNSFTFSGVAYWPATTTTIYYNNWLSSTGFVGSVIYLNWLAPTISMSWTAIQFDYSQYIFRSLFRSH